MRTLLAVTLLALGPASAQAAQDDPAAALSRAREALPRTPPELVALLQTRHDEARRVLDGGQLGSLYLPALLAKDVALRLDTHVDTLPESARMGASEAVRRLVLAAWTLDALGDAGDQVNATHAFDRFSAAVTAITHAYAAR